MYFYRPKRSFGQGNVFTRVCDSVNRGGVPAPIFRGGACSKFSGGGIFSGGYFFGGGGIFSGGVFFGGGCSIFSEYGHRSAGTHPTGMHSCCILMVKFDHTSTV